MYRPRMVCACGPFHNGVRLKLRHANFIEDRFEPASVELKIHRRITGINEPVVEKSLGRSSILG